MSRTYRQASNDKRERWVTDALVRSADVAEYLAVSVRTVERLTSEEDLPHYRIGHSIRYRPSEVETWTMSRSTEPQALPRTLAGLRAQRQLGDRVTANLRELVAEARAEGYSWQRIGDALGVTRQAVMKRFKSA
jgi:excisionase family DNA binding protein